MLRIVSGGQTGVDRGALDAALEAGVPCGGWCPRGRRAEDGHIPDRYPLRETGSTSYPARTRRNVRDADATLILHRGPLRGGSALTGRLAREMGRPCLALRLGADADLHAAARWLQEHAVQTLNVAGPRESEAPGIREEARLFVAALIGIARGPS